MKKYILILILLSSLFSCSKQCQDTSTFVQSTGNEDTKAKIIASLLENSDIVESFATRLDQFGKAMEEKLSSKDIALPPSSYLVFYKHGLNISYIFTQALRHSPTNITITGNQFIIIKNVNPRETLPGNEVGFQPFQIIVEGTLSDQVPVNYTISMLKDSKKYTLLSRNKDSFTTDIRGLLDAWLSHLPEKEQANQDSIIHLISKIQNVLKFDISFNSKSKIFTLDYAKSFPNTLITWHGINFMLIPKFDSSITFSTTEPIESYYWQDDNYYNYTYDAKITYKFNPLYFRAETPQIIAYDIYSRCLYSPNIMILNKEGIVLPELTYYDKTEVTYDKDGNPATQIQTTEEQNAADYSVAIGNDLVITGLKYNSTTDSYEPIIDPTVTKTYTNYIAIKSFNLDYSWKELFKYNAKK